MEKLVKDEFVFVPEDNFFYSPSIEKGDPDEESLLGIRECIMNSEIFRNKNSAIREYATRIFIVAMKAARDSKFVLHTGRITIREDYPRFLSQKFYSEIYKEDRYVNFSVAAETKIVGNGFSEFERIYINGIDNDSSIEAFAYQIFLFIYKYLILNVYHGAHTDRYMILNLIDKSPHVRKIFEGKAPVVAELLEAIDKEARRVINKHNSARPIKKERFIKAFSDHVPLALSEKASASEIAALMKFSPGFLREFAHFLAANRRIRAAKDSIPGEWIEAALNAIEVESVIKKLYAVVIRKVS